MFLRNLTQYCSCTEYKPFFCHGFPQITQNTQKNLCSSVEIRGKKFLNRTLLEPDPASLAAPENPLALTMSKLAR